MSVVDYNDGFVAYLNGIEVARRNAPVGILPWDAASNPAPAGYAAVVQSLNPSAYYRLNKQLLNHAGGITSWYHDLAYMVAPLSSQSGPIILQLARYDDIYLAESFPNGGDGVLFEFEGIGTPNGTVDGNPESLKIGSNFVYLNARMRAGSDGGGERLSLLRAADPPQGTTTIPLVIEDRVDYNDTAPWPTSPDGRGDSLHRDLSDLWAGDTASWSAGLPSPGRFGPIVTTAFSPGTQTIGEAGQLNGLTHVVQPVFLTQSHTNPVVFTQPASMPAGIR